MGACVKKPFTRPRWQEQTITESDISQALENQSVSNQAKPRTSQLKIDARNFKDKQNKVLTKKQGTISLKQFSHEEQHPNIMTGKFIEVNGNHRENIDLPPQLEQQYRISFGKMSNNMNQFYKNQGFHRSLISCLSQSQILPADLESDPKGLMQIISNLSIDLISREPKQSKLITKSNVYQQEIKKVRFIEQHPAKYYYFKDQIGSGGACVVFKAYLKRPQQNLDDSNFSQITSSVPFAVRVFKLNNLTSIDRMRHEIAVMNVCSSPNIMKYHFSYLFRDSLFMFTEYMNGGSLTRLIKRQKQIPEDLIAYIIKQILLGLRVIHRNGQIHRDIKSDNILMNDQGDIKIGDFGHALQISKQEICKDTQIVGTPAWMAPQLIKKELYTQAVDIWSLGIVLYQLCQGEPPYLRLNQYKAMYMVVSKPAPEINKNSKILASFAAQCLQKNAQERCTVDELLLHPFITGIGKGTDQKNKLSSLIRKFSKKSCNKR